MAVILLIDDDVDLVEMNQAVLEARGHQVRSAYSAAGARKLLDGVRPDLAVLDVMMESDTAGFELARDIHERYADLPMILVTGIHEAAGVPFRFAPDETWLPVVKILDKPVTPAALADEVEAILSR